MLPTFSLRKMRYSMQIQGAAAPEWVHLQELTGPYPLTAVFGHMASTTQLIQCVLHMQDSERDVQMYHLQDEFPDVSVSWEVTCEGNGHLQARLSRFFHESSGWEIKGTTASFMKVLVHARSTQNAHTHVRQGRDQR